MSRDFDKKITALFLSYRKILWIFDSTKKCCAGKMGSLRRRRWSLHYKLYVDTFWITLCLMDMVAFLTTVYFLKYEKRMIRCLVLAAVSASAEVLLYVWMPYYWLYRVLMLCVVNPCIVIGLLYPLQKELFLRGYLLITGILLFIGGVQTVVLYWIPIGQGIALWNVLIAIVGAGLCLLLRYRSKQMQHECQVNLRIKDKEIGIMAYHDTGNLLRDPYTGKPVSIVEKSLLEENRIPMEQFRYIPYHTVGAEQGLLPVFTIDEMTIRQEKRVIQIKQPVIGLSEKELFLRQNIHMILHSELL